MKKYLIAFLVGVFVLVIFITGYFILKLSNSSQKNNYYPVSFVSVPVSFTVNNNSATAEPVDAASFEKRVTDSADCTDIQSGIISYSLKTSEPTVSKSGIDFMIVNNISLQAEKRDVDLLDSFINKTSNYPELTEFTTLRISCGGIMYRNSGDLNVNYPDTDKSRAVWGFGTLQFPPQLINQIPVEIKVYAKKGSNYILLNKIIPGDLVFTEKDFKDCSTSTKLSNIYSCLSTKNANISKLESEATKLVAEFKLK